MPRAKSKPPMKATPKAVRKPRTSVRKTATDSLQNPADYPATVAGLNRDSIATEVSGSVKPVRKRRGIATSPDRPPLKCKKHPRYGVLRRPRAECADCWAMWLSKLAREQGIRPDTEAVRKTYADFLREAGIDRSVVIGGDAQAEPTIRALCKALGVDNVEFVTVQEYVEPAKRVSKRRDKATSPAKPNRKVIVSPEAVIVRPDTDDPRQMGPLVDDDISFDDDDEPGGE